MLLQNSKHASVRKINRKFSFVYIGIIEIENNDTVESIYIYSYTSGPLISTSVVTILLLGYREPR